MRISSDRKELADALKAVSKFLPRVPTITPTAGILMGPADGGVRFTATDLEATRQVDVAASVASPETCLVPAEIASIVAGADGDDITLATEGNALTVTAAASTWELELLHAEDYPTSLLEVEDAEKVAVESWDRLRAVAAIANPASPQVNLRGVLLEDGVAVATDSYRMAHVDFGEGDHEPALVPARSILALEGDVSALEVGHRRVRAHLDDGEWGARVIDANFPKWRSLIDRFEPQAWVTVPTEDLSDALRRALLGAPPEIPVIVELAANGIRITRNAIPAFSETVMAATEGEMGTSAAFNIKFLASMISPAEEVKLELQGPNQMARITGDDWWHGVLMSVRV